MGRLNLVIADTDEDYIESLANFLVSDYSQRFQVSYFTNKDCLHEYLLGNSKSDILLLAPELYCDSLIDYESYTLILLSGGRININAEGKYLINKYQKGDELAKNILNIYSMDKGNEVYTSTGNKDTKVISVYSPVGGSGKTSVAVSSCILCATAGLSVFYLNLEEFSSTEVFFNCESNQNLSNILYYVKEQHKNLRLKIEATRCIDPKYGIHYFEPPDSALELSEMLPDEIKLLIDELKTMGQYDILFIDLPSCLSSNILSALEVSDEVFLIGVQNEISITKLSSFVKELTLYENRIKSNILEKAIFILNKYNFDIPTDLEDIDFNGHHFSLKIPVVYEMMVENSQWPLLEYSSSFGINVSQLVSKYMRG